MKIRIKKVLCNFLAVLLISFSVATSTYAADHISIAPSGILEIDSEKVDALNDRLSKMSYSEIRTVLISEFGASPEEATALAEYQKMSTMQTRVFPSKPNIGAVHKESYTIKVSLGATAATLAAAIVSGTKYVSLAKALTIAGAVLALGSEVFGRNVRVTISYTYGYTNDGVLGWTPGYTEYKII